MNYVVFDIETQNTFRQVGKNQPSLLDISVVCLYDKRSDSYETALYNELEILWPYFEKADVLVGFNQDHFDIPLINKHYPGDLSRIRSIDLLECVRQSIGKRIRLDSIASATLGKKKSGNGLAAITWWKNGEFEKVKAYCKKDVEITKDLFEYARENKHLYYFDGHLKKEIPIDTSKWESQQGHVLTHSLPF